MDVDAKVYRQATEARQDAQTALLTTIDADTGAAAGYLATLAGMAEGEMRTLIAGFEDHSDWTVLNDETETKADTTVHITGEGAVSFEKVTGDTVVAGLKRAITAIDLSDYVGDSRVGLNIYLSDIDDVVSVEVRLGTDVDNTQVWEVLVKDLVAGWNLLSFPVGDVETDVGDGWNDAVVTYAVVAVNFSAVTDTLAGIIVDNLSMRTAGAETVRAKVAEANAAKVATDRVMMVQPLDAAGRVIGQQPVTISDFEDHTDWTVLNDETSGKADETTHITGTKATTFNKVTGDSLVAGIYDTIASLDVSGYGGQGVVNLIIYLSSIDRVTSVEVRLGTDITNANIWRVPIGKLAVGWNRLSFKLGDVTADLGNGWNDAVVTHAAVAVNFHAVTDTLSGIIVDSLTMQWMTAVNVRANADPFVDRPSELVIAGCNDGDDGFWAPSFYAENVTRGTEWVTGTGSVMWDKHEDAGEEAGVMRAFADGAPIDASQFGPDDYVAVTFKCPEITYTGTCHLWLGTDSDHRWKWQWDEQLIPADKWVTVYKKISDFYGLGAAPGLAPGVLGAIKSVNFYVKFTTSAYDLDELMLDRISIISAEKYAAIHAKVPTLWEEDLAAVETADAGWTAITLTVGATAAEFALSGSSAYLVCKTKEPADADTGAIFFPGITYRKETVGRTKIWFRRTATAEAKIHVTDMQ